MEHLLAATLIDFCGSFKASEWTGAPNELLQKLNSFADQENSYSRDWPNNAIALSKRLNGLKSSLLTQGIDIAIWRGKERKITIKKTDDFA